MKVEILKAEAKGLEDKLLTEEQTDIIKLAFTKITRKAFVDIAGLSEKEYDKNFSDTAQEIMNDILLDAQKSIIETFVFENIIKGSKSKNKKVVAKKTKKVVKKTNKKTK